MSFFDLIRQDFFYFSILQIASFLVVGLPIGYLLVHKNLGLFSDSLSHSLIPGLAGSVMIFGLKSESLAFGAIAWGLVVTVIFSMLGGITTAIKDSLLVAISLIGISLGLILNQHFNLRIDFSHLLFGSPLLTDKNDLYRSVILNSLLVIFTIINWKKLLLFCVDPVFARIKFGEFKINFLFTFLTTMLIVSGFQIFGVLLTTGLLILPTLIFMKRKLHIITQFTLNLILTLGMAILCFWISYQLNLTFSSIFIFCLSSLAIIRLIFLKRVT